MTAATRSAAFDATLLPGSVTIDATGRCSVGGCDLAELADRFGTPLYVYDEAELRARCRAYASAFGGENVAYAAKAALFGALVRVIAEEGLALDVASGGELHLAVTAGFPAERIVMHGNNKSSEELEAAIDAGVGLIVIDSHDEIDRIEALGAHRDAPVAVLVRVTPGVSADTHAHIETGTDTSKFGLALTTGAALDAVKRVAASSQLDFAGVHCHIGSQVVQLEAYRESAQRMAELVAAIEADLGLVRRLSLGGGLGVRYRADDRAPTIEEYGRSITTAIDAALTEVGVQSHPRLMVEPGRSIAAPTGLTLYRVGTVKRVNGETTYVAVDGGMSDNARPITYGAEYEAFLPARAASERPLVATIAGKHCEQGDLLVRDATLPREVVVGDVLAIAVTGAYSHSMASNYNRVPRPAVVMVADGDARLVVRRESLDDLLALDLDLGGHEPA